MSTSALGPKADPLLSLRGLSKTFAGRPSLLSRRGPAVRAVDGITLDLARGETLGLVGETGSGKSTLGRLILRLIDPDEGSILFEGTDLAQLSKTEMRRRRSRIQMVFQDPYGSLDPRMTVRQLVAEPMIVHGVPGAEIPARLAATLRHVGLDPSAADRYPHEFSGGQRQRIGIARALVLDPQLLVLDEPVSALDVSIQAQILNLLADIQRRTGIAYVFIGHDLAVVRHVSTRVAVMYLGRIVEIGPRDTLYGRPQHPYTVSLLSAIPRPDPVRERSRTRVLPLGEIGSATAVPPGCHFHPRCPRARAVATRGGLPTRRHRSRPEPSNDERARDV
jgi:oligopeptide transport system ATP-binding protein